jgi:uncharacterized protein YndB with AHSA1/START domain
MRIEQTLVIAAPAALVWRVIVDLERYPEWNPFVVACRSTLAVGAPIEMRVRGLAPWALSQREEILAHEPGRRLCYGLRGAFLGAISSERCHLVTEREPALAHYRSTFALGGGLAPLVRALLGRRLARGFCAMTGALARRAEALAAQERAAAGPR